MSRLDLHMHSIYSDDGSYTPTELMDLCKAAGLRVAALTDHNSALGVAEAARRATELGLELIPGIELDCQCGDINLHLLGYGIRHEDERLRKVEQEVLELNQRACAERVRLVKEQGIFFDEEKVWANAWNGVVTGEMIGEIALKDERNHQHPLMQELYPGGSRSDNPFVNFYWDVCGPGKPAHVPIEYMSFEKAQKLIEALGGVSVIAHPGQTVKENEELISYMKSKGVVGMEAYSSYHTPLQVTYYEKLAEKLGLVKTPGSDFHGKTKPSVKLGKVPGEVSEAEVRKMLEK